MGSSPETKKKIGSYSDCLDIFGMLDANQRKKHTRDTFRLLLRFHLGNVTLDSSTCKTTEQTGLKEKLLLRWPIYLEILTRGGISHHQTKSVKI